MKVVVSDSTVLIGLAKIGKIDLLRELFREIYVPEAVFREVTEDGWMHTCFLLLRAYCCQQLCITHNVDASLWSRRGQMKGTMIKFAIASALASVIAAGAASASISTPQADQFLSVMQQKTLKSQRLRDLAKLHRATIKPVNKRP